VSIFEECFRTHKNVIALTEQACREPLERLSTLAARTLRNGGKLLFFGNGGSASDAQHLATELAIRFEKNRRALSAMALTTDTSVLTACANDYGFERIFARQIEALGRPGDLAIGLSTSGRSPNVLAGLRYARENKIGAAGFSGRGGGEMKEYADPLVIVPADDTPRIQEMHALLGHIFCAEVEHQLELV
jgi:D-sedoheptulose 7-phosphate isomerase